MDTNHNEEQRQRSSVKEKLIALKNAVLDIAFKVIVEKIVSKVLDWIFS